MHVVVTGAAGAVGSQVVDILIEKGHSVIAIDLPRTQIRRHKRIASRYLDLTKIGNEELRQLIGTCASSIIHTAAVVDISLPEKELIPINVNLVEKLIFCAPESLETFVHLSTGSLYGPSNEPLAEDSLLVPTNAYEGSKLWAEQKIRVAATSANNQRCFKILRPALVYGPKAKALGAALATIPPLLKETLGRNVFGFTGGPKTNWVHTQDVAAAAVHLMNRKYYSLEILNVADDDPAPIGDVISEYINAYGLNIVAKTPLPSPNSLKLLSKGLGRLPIIGATNGILGPAWRCLCWKHDLEKELYPKVYKEALAYIGSDTIFDNRELKFTGFELQYPSKRKAIPSVLDWYRSNRWIP